MKPTHFLSDEKLNEKDVSHGFDSILSMNSIPDNTLREMNAL